MSFMLAHSQPYKDKNLPVESRVKDLIERMTVEEKVGQLSKRLGWEMYDKSGNTVAISTHFKDVVNREYIGMLWGMMRADPWTKKTLENGLASEEAAKVANMLQRYMLDSTRLGIPLLLSEETPHGHMAIGSTVFPTAIGQASTWNVALIEQMAKIIAKETYAVGGRNGYGPILDLARDPRWSRTEETYGEDSYLVGRMGEAMVLGLQGQYLGQEDKIVSTLKHFTAYGVPQGGHNGSAVMVGERALRTQYLRPFERAVHHGAWSVMSAYNSIDGIPCTANGWLLNDILREEWQFKGFVVSDLFSISGLKNQHQVASTASIAAAQSLNAGVDVDLSGEDYNQNLLEAYQTGLVNDIALDRAVERVLTLKFSLGLFDNPYTDVSKVKSKVATKENIQIAKQVARESIVLLKNNKQLLPLRKNIKRIAVIGPNANMMYNQLGDYTAPQPDGKVKTVLDGVRKIVSKNTIVDYVKGCAIRDTTQTDIQSAVKASMQADAVIVVLGGSSARDFKTSYQPTGAANVSTDNAIADMESGEGFDRASLELMGDQLKLLQAIHGTGKPIVLVLIKGRPLQLNWASQYIDAIVDAWYPGQEGGNAIAEVIFGDYNPSGKLPISIPKSVGQLPVYYNYLKPIHHNYIEIDARPLYPFGYGLSYTNFQYSNIQVTVDESKSVFAVSVQVEVKNVGQYDGEEVVQVYCIDDASSVVTPNKSLVQFGKQFIPKGESRVFQFDIAPEDLRIWGLENKWVVEKGTFKIQVGNSSEDIRESSSFELKKDYYF